MKKRVILEFLVEDLGYSNMLEEVQSHVRTQLSLFYKVLSQRIRVEPVVEQDARELHLGETR